MRRSWIFLVAYTCSGVAALVYEVTWTRLFALSMGHTIAAASSVLAAFMGGLSAGAFLGGHLAARIRPHQALYAYGLLELVVLAAAGMMPWALAATTPLLRWAYQNGDPGLLFPLVRLTSSLFLLLVPTVALGATLPVAARWFASGAARARQTSGALYAANTAGAAGGAFTAGFMLLPAIGLRGTTHVALILTSTAIVAVLWLARTAADDPELPQARTVCVAAGAVREAPEQPRLAAAVVGATGLATFTYEVAWMRVFAAIIGPSTYAFAATISAFIAGLAAGSAVGAAAARRLQRPELAIGLSLAAAAVAANRASSYAGAALPARVIRALGGDARPFNDVLFQQGLLVAMLIVPTAFALGLIFPLALELAGGTAGSAARRTGVVYAVNTVGAVIGALGAGFAAIPLVGLQRTLQIGTVALLGAAVLVAARAALSVPQRLSVLGAAAVAAAMVAWSAPWDRQLMASGVYHRASAPGGMPVDAAVAVLKAGTLLYYREGPTGTVSVKRLNGTLSLAIDGKVDASTSGDMLTQKALAHLPLLLHPDPARVAIIGLGSGVTLASALTHPVTSVDVVEISPEVVEASRHFAAVNRNALDAPRTRLILGDGRSHLLLSDAAYDVIVSEPSNPWMAGVASLFTREFFEAARNRLAPGGVLCQWAHTYSISDADLRSIVATFAAVFPDGTMWLVGDGDLLLVGSSAPLEPLLANIERHWTRPEVAADLAGVSAQGPFAFLSMFTGGSVHLRAYGRGAAVQTDDRMALEFSGPAALFGAPTADNASTLGSQRGAAALPDAVVRAEASATAKQWLDRGRMMLAAEADDSAYENFVMAARLDPANPDALDGLVEAAVATRRDAAAVTLLKERALLRPGEPALWIALSRLHVSAGHIEAALHAAMAACRITPLDPAALEQLASLYSDAGDAGMLAPIAGLLLQRFPERASAAYYGAASEFLQGRLEAALALAQRAVLLDRAHAPAQNLRGAILAQLGQAGEARAAFETALRLDPGDSAAYTNFALMELAFGNRDAATKLFGEALALNPSSAAGWEGLAKASR
jgi:spermidine synthase